MLGGCYEFTNITHIFKNYRRRKEKKVFNEIPSNSITIKI